MPKYLTSLALFTSKSSDRQAHNNRRKLTTQRLRTLVENNKKVIVKCHLPTAKTNTYILCGPSGRMKQKDSGHAHGISYSAEENLLSVAEPTVN